MDDKGEVTVEEEEPPVPFRGGEETLRDGLPNGDARRSRVDFGVINGDLGGVRTESGGSGAGVFQAEASAKPESSMWLKPVRGMEDEETGDSRSRSSAGSGVRAA